MSKQTKLSYNLQLKLSIIVMLIFSFSYIATKNRKISSKKKFIKNYSFKKNINIETNGI